MLLIPEFRRQKQMDLLAQEQTVRHTPRNPVLPKKKKKGGGGSGYEERNLHILNSVSLR
jgi:hypothetical protein